MSVTPGTGKKKKRTGEDALFSEQGKLTDEAFYFCKISGIEPKNLYHRSLDTFLRKHPQKEAEKLALAYEQQRSDYI